MSYVRTKSLLFGLSMAALAFLVCTFLVPPMVTAAAEDVPAPVETSAGGIAGVLWDLFGHYGWKAAFVLLIMGTVAGLNLGGGKMAARYGWPRLGAVLETNEWRLGSVFLLAFFWSVMKALGGGEVWSKPVFTDAADFAAKAIAGHQIWKHVLQDRVRGLFGKDDAAPEVAQS